MAQIAIGTSGWHYPSWRGPFFPPEVMAKHHLLYYATQFSTVELNGVFYRMPSEKAVEAWRDQTGEDFVFAWKASRYITHWTRLSVESLDSIRFLESRVSRLGAKAGPILFQLPPQLTVDRDRLGRFVAKLPHRRRYTFEFRHPSWYAAPILRVLSDHNIALCFSDHHHAPAPWRRTADFIYIRGHGPGGRYNGNYPSSVLEAWSRKLRGWKRRGYDAFVYFDNDQKSAAPSDGLKLKRLVGQLP